MTSHLQSALPVDPFRYLVEKILPKCAATGDAVMTVLNQEQTGASIQVGHRPRPEVKVKVQCDINDVMHSNKSICRGLNVKVNDLPELHSFNWTSDMFSIWFRLPNSITTPVISFMDLY